MPLKWTAQTIESQPWFASMRTIVQTCNELRNMQAEHGGFNSSDIGRGLAGIERLLAALQEVEPYFASPYLRALRADLDGWVRGGLSNRPKFDQSLEAYQQTENHSFGFGLFPIRDVTRKTSSVRLEAFVYYRNEHPLLDEFRRQYRDQRYQAAELLLASEGIADNNVFTLFPEAVSVNRVADQKQFALFFHNKYLDIFFQITKPLGRFLIRQPLAVWEASPDQIYDARTISSYLHDLYHYSGPLPLDQFLRVKSSMLASCLEEIRVDTHVYLLLSERKEELCHLAAEILLLDRVYRYSFTDEPAESFDCLTNYFFFSYLLTHGGVRFTDKQLTYEPLSIKQNLSRLAGQLEELEKRLLCTPVGHCDRLISEWLGSYLTMEMSKQARRTLFADWLIRQGTRRGIPRTISWRPQNLNMYA
ncbi:MAG: hypothetical protein H0Z34_03595 [Brevibacillus sp.]|nr:hypothetical protein [Brevibacillus sp.]